MLGSGWETGNKHDYESSGNGKCHCSQDKTRKKEMLESATIVEETDILPLIGVV